ncbi:hypothetical protein SporoP37_15895 [Sporosarcina sp. P37]|uniref:phage baseplate assembly protein V n=1 Tax=unclassified Sporosarcina TaxID=2647733 RepID=UPI000A17B44D|nr:MULTISPECIES: phage baseplate assembly protein V [unclassified Sporosarcina]ARK26009.1 hypothetical protein SporoP37_15895 [Sporosarcina sp. P37]PID19377.1 phage baseplate assembly protein V [Sporosarcina sp. P35]
MRVQVGEVVVIDPANATARVKFEELDGKVSAPLRMVFSQTLKTKHYSMPSVGEHVLCLFTKETEGFILGSFYSEETEPPRNDPSKYVKAYEDGSLIEYDTVSHTLSLDIVGDIHIRSGAGNIVTVNGQMLSNTGTLTPKGSG